MNNNTEQNNLDTFDDLDDLARSNVTTANIYRNFLNQEMDEEERHELRIGL